VESPSVQGRCRGSDVVLQGDGGEGVDERGDSGAVVESSSVQGLCRRV
jgi:hypothetical protein